MAPRNALSELCEDDSESRQRPLPVSRLAGTYLLLVPLIVFAVHGGFSFEHGSWNSNLGAVGGKLAFAPTHSETVQEEFQSWGALTLCLLAMVPSCRNIASICITMPVLFALPLYAMLSALWSQDASLSLRSGLSLLVSTWFAFYLAGRFSERQQMELILLAGGLVLALSLALAIFWPEYGVDHQLHEGAWQGLFTQKNVCAQVTLFLLTPALALRSTGRHGQLMRAAYVAVCLLVIAMTQSRTGWAVTALFLLFTLCLRTLGRLGRRDLLPVAVLGLAAAGGTAIIAVEFPAAIFSLFSRSDSVSGRVEIWNAIIASILRQPLCGYGFDAFWSLLQGEASRVFAATGWIVTSAHNGFLNVGLELGLVGLILVATTFFQALRHARLAFHPGRSPYVDWCIGIVFLTFVYNLDERTLMATQSLPWILYLVACTGLARTAYERGCGVILPAGEEYGA